MALGVKFQKLREGDESPGEQSSILRCGGTFLHVDIIVVVLLSLHFRLCGVSLLFNKKFQKLLATPFLNFALPSQQTWLPFVSGQAVVSTPCRLLVLLKKLIQ